MSTPTEKYDVKRALVVCNEHSTNAARLRRQIKRLDVATEIIKTERDPRYVRDELHRLARRGDVILAGGGDGTSHYVGNVLLAREAQERGLHHVPFVPLRAGYANDTAVMINRRASPRAIIHKGRYMQLHPLQVTVEDPGGEITTRYAFGYFGVGATAEASQEIEKLKESTRRLDHNPLTKFARKAVVTWATIAEYPQFEVEQPGHGLQTVTDLSFLRGDRIAKYGRPHGEMAGDVFEFNVTGHTGYLPSLRAMLQMQQGRTHGELVDQSSMVVESADGADILTQYDGEVQAIKSGSLVSVAIATDAYHTLSTHLHVA